MQQRVAHVLSRNVQDFVEFLASLEFAEFNGRASPCVVNRVEFVVFDQLGIEADVFLPLVKKVLPIVEIRDLSRHSSLLASLNLRAFERRAIDGRKRKANANN